MGDTAENPQASHQKLSRRGSIRERECRGYAFGPFAIDIDRRRLLRDGQIVTAAPKVLETLLVLVEHAGQVVEKDELLQKVWPDTFVEEANLTQNVFTLRKLLGDAAVHPEYIATIPRRGYRFVAPVRQVGVSEQQGPVALPVQTFREHRRLIMSVVAASLAAGVVWLAVERAAPHHSDRAVLRLPPAYGRMQSEEALAAFRKARYFIAKPRRGDKRQSIRYFEQAIAHDPEFARAHAELARAYVLTYLLGDAVNPDVTERAIAHAARALALDSTSSEAHNAVAHVRLQIEQNWAEAEPHLQEALRLDPNNADAYDLLARGLRQRERFAESIAAARRQVELEPLSATAHANLASSLYQSRALPDETAAAALAALELDPSDTRMERTLAALYEAQGNQAQAVAAWQRYERLNEREDAARALARDYAERGFHEAMQRFSFSTLTRLHRAELDGRYEPVEFTIASVRIGEFDRAIDYLTRTRRAGRNPALFAVAHDPFCEPLTRDVRFTRLLQELVVAADRIGASGWSVIR